MFTRNCLFYFWLALFSFGFSTNLNCQLKEFGQFELDNLSLEDCFYLDSCLRINHNNLNIEVKIEYYTALQSAFEEEDNYFMALSYSDSLQLIYEKNGDRPSLADVLYNKSMIHDNLGQYPEALTASQDALAIYLELGDKSGEAYCYNDIGILHYYRDEDSLAQLYLNKSLPIFRELKDTFGMSIYYINMANTLSNEEKYETSLEMYQKALEFDRIKKDLEGQAIALGNMGEIYTAIREYDKAISSFNQALEIAEAYGDPWTISNPLRGLGELYRQTGKIDKAIEVVKRSVELTNEIDALAESSHSYLLLYQLYKKKGDPESAIKYLELHKTFEDSLFNQNKERMISEMEMKYQVKDKAHEIELLNKAHEIEELEHKQELDAEENKVTTLAIGLSAIGLILLFAIRGFLMKKKSNETLREQNAIIEEKNKEITDSIRYAKRIQSAILPPNKVVREYLENSFIYYEPKDIVAGDFYWMEQKDGQILFAAADCTGHGVPGAMVSVVCNNGLNRSVRELNLTDPGKILDNTREIVIQEFEKSEEEVKDGMDIALCNLDLQGLADHGGLRQLRFAGANNPIWIIRKDSNQIEEIKGDKQPIGKFSNPEPYTTHSVELAEGDTFYIFTDGYADQFGGENGKKMKTGNFKKLLLSIQHKTMPEQLVRIKDAFEEWKGELEQIDDVCVIGVRV